MSISTLTHKALCQQTMQNQVSFHELFNLEEYIDWEKINIGNSSKFKPQTVKIYLNILSRTGLINRATIMAGVNRRTILNWRKTYCGFEQAEDAAISFFIETCMGELYRRGVIGFVRPVVNRRSGKVICYVREYSDKCLKLLLRGIAPEKYGNVSASSYSKALYSDYNTVSRQ